MGYGRLADRLEDGGPGVAVTAFPDGSVDRFYRVSVGDERVARRETFGKRIAAGDPEGFSMEPEAVETGGHAVNMAKQAAALGDAVTLFGHLDHPGLDDLDFPTASMGRPAAVCVLEFDDGSVLLVEESADLRGWSLADLRAAAGGSLAEPLSADVIFCTNWASVDGMTDAIREIASLDASGRFFVFDPGELAGVADRALDGLVNALDALSGTFEPVVSVNRPELDRLADACGVPGGADDPERLDGIRSATGAAGVVLHARSEAAASTPEGTVAIPAIDVEQPVRRTGAGDRFDAGLAHALGLDWGWADALRLGNLCAARFVETATTGDPDDLAGYARGATPT